MEKLILDASVVIKWFIPEEGSDKALLFLERYKKGEISIIVPNLLLYELGNSLLNKKVKAKETYEAIEILTGEQHVTFADMDAEFFTDIFQNAQEFTISFYDASYITLMQKENCELITADKKLYQKVSKKFSLIKLL